MPLKIYNTLKKKKEEFTPLEANRVGIYACGITAYDYSHIGHARSAVVFDVVVRYLRSQGYEVLYVRNFTDIDDKIIKKSQEQNTPVPEIAHRFIEAYREDMESLGVNPPDVEPLATEYIPRMIETIQKLIENGHAYQADSDVYFAVDSFRGYGKLSKRDIEEMIAGTRFEVDERKRNPLDFALWKGAKPGEPEWDSPWGKGRPGWHIECSVMSASIIGPTLDIHGGGKDLIFPHHENEIAQAEGATGKPFVRFWMHNGFVNMNKEKMSKSLGNVLNIRELVKLYHPEVVRFFLLSKHYRSPLDYSDEVMKEMENALGRMYKLVQRIDEAGADGSAKAPAGIDEIEKDMTDKAESLMKEFREAMDDDFNTARAIGYLFPLVKSANRLLDEAGDSLTPDNLVALKKTRAALMEVGSLLGLLQAPPREFFGFLKDRELKEAGVDRDEIQRLVDQRAEARRSKDWARADTLRDKLSELNVIVEDRPEGPVWRFA